MFHKGYKPTEEHRRHLSESRKGIVFSEEHMKNLSLSHLGKKQSLESIEKRRQLLLGRKQSPELVEKRRLANIGKKRTPEQNEEMSKRMKGRKLSEEWKRKIGIASKGRKHTEETKGKMSEMLMGKNGSNWKGGISSINERIRRGLKIRLWREAVFKRDNYTCVQCGLRSGNGKRVILNSDHIQSFAFYPELRFELTNGRTLCLDCHRKTDNFGSKSYNNDKESNLWQQTII